MQHTILHIQWGSPMFWVTQRPLLRVHSSSGRCARQRSRLVSPGKHLHKFWQKIALNCRHIQHEFVEYSSWKTQTSKVNLSSWKPTTLPSCLPFPPYPSQDPSNGSSSGKILFVFLQSAQFVLWKHSCDQFHCFGLESPQWNTKISMTYPAVQSCCKWSSAAIKLASGTLGGEHDFQEVEKRECAIWTCDVYSVGYQPSFHVHDANHLWNSSDDARNESHAALQSTTNMLARHSEPSRTYLYWRLHK